MANPRHPQLPLSPRSPLSPRLPLSPQLPLSSPSILSPLLPPYSEEVAAALALYPPQDGYLLALFRTFANSVRSLKKAVPNLLDRTSPLSLRFRDIVNLRTTAHRNCEYE